MTGKQEQGRQGDLAGPTNQASLGHGGGLDTHTAGGFWALAGGGSGPLDVHFVLTFCLTSSTIVRNMNKYVEMVFVGLLAVYL